MMNRHSRATIMLLLLPLLFQSLCHHVDAVEFQWTRNAVNYPSEGQRLVGHVTATYNNVFAVSQCAFRCQLLPASACASYNFLSANRTCEINAATHVTNPADVTTATDSQYFLRDAFSIDQAALGPCGSSPCQNQGTCLSTTNSAGSLEAFCLCTDGWTGSTCGTADTSLSVWDDWSDWTACSTTCGDGFKQRGRRCVNGSTREVVSVQLCYGRDKEQMYCNVGSCPAWTAYSDWGQCSTDGSCGQGVSQRTRSCSNGGTAGVDRMCMGPSSETTVCQSPSCSVPVQLVNGGSYGEGRVSIYNDVSGAWLPVCAAGWTNVDADVTCHQLGFQSGSYRGSSSSVNFGVDSTASGSISNVSCQGSEASLATCPHRSWNDASCAAAGPHAGVQCIVDGRWGRWSDWSSCSVTCANGISVRTRQCDSPAPARGGRYCVGASNETKACSLAPCPVDAAWADWQAWSTCSRSCGGGNQTRTRVCNPGRYGGSDCLGESEQTQTCNTQPCPVDGVFSVWSDWDTCSVTCGNGTQSRRRTCTPPQFGGQPCVGQYNETQACFPKFCPVDGTWGPWSDWSLCNATCGGGSQYRTRVCYQPLHGGVTCDGQSSETQPCNQQSCAIDGVWQDYGAWSSCNATCGSGTRVRVRACYGPFFGGRNCDGEAQQLQFCNDNPCPVNGQWSAWSRWLDCSVSCSIGIQQRYRLCEGATNGGEVCPGQPDETQSCDAGPCPVNCTWLTWSSWSTCNATCGGGSKQRTRGTIPAQYGGAACVGNSIEYDICNTNPCPIPGLWTPWSDWTLCSVTCGTGGLRSRTRTCNMTSFGSLTIDCLPEAGVGATETQACHQFSCTPIAASCQELYTRGLQDNTYVTIDPDTSGTNNPFTVYCKRNGTGVYTTVHTLDETPKMVQGYEGACEFNAPVQYVDNRNNTISVNQLIPLVDQSTSCRQFVQWRCLAAAINTMDSASREYRLTFWRNRNAQDMGYWGGATPVSFGSTGTMMCQCGETRSCGTRPNYRCQCDENDNIWRSDEGYITKNADLPVQSFCAGDTGSTGEQGYFVVGPLICSN